MVDHVLQDPVSPSASCGMYSQLDQTPGYRNLSLVWAYSGPLHAVDGPTLPQRMLMTGTISS